MATLKEKFNELEPDKKRKVVAVTVIALLLVALYFYATSTSADRKVNVAPDNTKKLTTDLTLEDEDYALRSSFNYEMEEATKQNEELISRQSAEIEALKSNIQKILEQRGQELEATAINNTNAYGGIEITGIPPIEMTDVQEPLPPIVITGNISHVANTKPVSPTTEQQTQKKALVNYIPSGTIIKGTLLNGMYAPTMSKGASKPYPALIRLDDLSFLPNGFRKDLEGCFLMGEAVGELSDSRVHVRTNRLSCISNDEQHVLEKQIKGFVNGGDGKVGIFGKIVANFGQIALSALLAEFISAAGDAIESSTQVISQNALGGVTSLGMPNEQDMLITAAGAGLGEASSMIAEFYLDIMTEMSPVIEISGGQSVEIIIDEGLELTLDDYKWIGVKENEIESKFKNIIIVN